MVPTHWLERHDSTSSSRRSTKRAEQGFRVSSSSRVDLGTGCRGAGGGRCPGLFARLSLWRKRKRSSGMSVAVGLRDPHGLCDHGLFLLSASIA